MYYHSISTAQDSTVRELRQGPVRVGTHVMFHHAVWNREWRPRSLSCVSRRAIRSLSDASNVPQSPALSLSLSLSHTLPPIVSMLPCFHAPMFPCFRVSITSSSRRDPLLHPPLNVERWIHDQTVAPFFFSEVLLLMDAHTLRTSRRQPFWEGTGELVLMDDTVSTVSTA